MWTLLLIVGIVAAGLLVVRFFNVRIILPSIISIDRSDVVASIPLQGGRIGIRERCEACGKRKGLRLVQLRSRIDDLDGELAIECTCGKLHFSESRWQSCASFNPEDD